MNSMTRFGVGLLIAAVGIVLASNQLLAATIYVDNLHGDDALDGKASRTLTHVTGPVKTVQRGLRLLTNGGRLVIANHGIPYGGTMAMSGSRHSGRPLGPVEIIGNGAVVDGSHPVPARAWKSLGHRLWKMTPFRKAHYQLILNDQPVPEHKIPADAGTLPDIPDGHWAAWRGSIYYRATAETHPEVSPFAFAYHDMGLSLVDVHNVFVTDLTFRHFRIDGINAHDRCTNVILDNVTSVGNGRTGLSVGGSSEVTAKQSTFDSNRKDSVQITEQGALELQDSTISQPVHVAE